MRSGNIKTGGISGVKRQKINSAAEKWKEDWDSTITLKQKAEES